MKELLQDCFSTDFAKKHFRSHANCCVLFCCCHQLMCITLHPQNPSTAYLLVFIVSFFPHMCCWNVSLVYVFPHLGVVILTYHSFTVRGCIYLLTLLFPLAVQLSMKRKLWYFVSEKGMMKITCLCFWSFIGNSVQTK